MLIFNLYQVYTRLIAQLGVKCSYLQDLFFKYDKIKKAPLYKSCPLLDDKLSLLSHYHSHRH